MIECLGQIDVVTFYKWIKIGGLHKKVELSETGSIVADQLGEICGKGMKTHVYNFFRQYSELKYLKKNLEEGEVILSVEFSRNYYNKQHREIQSAYFGHDMCLLYKKHCPTEY